VLVAVIVACEVGFWVFVGAGLVSRYVLGLPRFGGILLLGAPVLDLVLLGATVIDLHGGATAEFEHGLAAVYLGFSVAFGHGLIRWADERFAHRFAGGPAPLPPARYGRERAVRERVLFGKAALAWAISCVLLITAIAIIGDADRTEELRMWLIMLTAILAVWSLWLITDTLTGQRAPHGR